MKKPRKNLSINAFIPNTITLTALCMGLSSVQLALEQRWELSITFIFIAAILDGLDGRIARLLKSTTKLGAELDSLADFCNFGIAPTIILYLYSLNVLNRFGWGVCLIYAICMSLRLARFNTFLADGKEDDLFFTGVPAPIGALLSIVPMAIDFQFGILLPSIAYAVYLLFIAFLVVSRIPTFSVKNRKIPQKYARKTFLCVGLMIILLLFLPWLTLSLLGIAYFALIPLSIKAKRSTH